MHEHSQGDARMNDYRGDRAAVWAICAWLVLLVGMFVVVL